MSLANNPYFWLGELGLIAVIIHCILVLYRERNKPLTVAIFFALAFISLYVLVHPAVVLPAYIGPTTTYLFRFVLGVAAGYRQFQSYLNSKSESATEQEKQELQKIKKISTWSGLTGLALMAWIAWKLR